MPKQTFMGMMQIVTGLPVPNFRVVVNCYPLSVEKEILKTEEEQEKLERSTENKMGRQAKLRVQAGMEKNALRVRRLMSNQVTGASTKTDWRKSPGKPCVSNDGTRSEAARGTDSWMRS